MAKIRYSLSLKFQGDGWNWKVKSTDPIFDGETIANGFIGNTVDGIEEIEKFVMLQVDELIAKSVIFDAEYDDITKKSEKVNK